MASKSFEVGRKVSGVYQGLPFTGTVERCFTPADGGGHIVRVTLDTPIHFNGVPLDAVTLQGVDELGTSTTPKSWVMPQRRMS